MKAIGITSTAILSLALGIAAPVFAQEEHHEQQQEEKDKPTPQHEKKTKQPKAAKQDKKTAQDENKNARQEEKKSAQQEDKNNKREEPKAQQQEQRTERAEPAKQEQRAGGNHGGRIPDDRFRANFGREHRFHVRESDYSRDRRFQYGGYWFGFVDPWPTNWLYTQDVFVVEIDGVYYLCNPMYPGVNIVLSVAL